MKAFKYIVIFSIFIQSCKKPYDDPPVQEYISNLVVECTITNEPPPYAVKLTMSVGYNSNRTPYAVTHAKISISDDAGNIEKVIENPMPWETTRRLPQVCVDKLAEVIN